MTRSLSSKINVNGKNLNLLCVALHDQSLPSWLKDEIKKAFRHLSFHIKNKEQVLYIRDIDFLAIRGEYPGGHCYNQHEAMLSVPDWGAERQQIIGSVNHELHHMARWQNAGYGDSLGGALVSEGIATYYEEFRSGWSSPWSRATVTTDALIAAAESWDNTDYNYSEWFFEGPLGNWVGYSIGYNLAEILFKDGFDLAKSVTINPAEVRSLIKQLIQSRK